MAPPKKHFVSSIKHVQAGESVSAGVASRAPKANEANALFLKEVVDSIQAGEALFIREATVAPSVIEGDAVHWSAENQRFEKAIAAVEPDAESGVLVTAASSDVTGVVHTKANDTLACLAILGKHRFSDNALTNAFGSTSPEAGRYYLSSDEPGKLVKQRPPVSVQVLQVCSNGDIILNPQLRDFLEDHIHYRFELEAQPAGTVDGDAAQASGRHEIITADPSVRGWLPADDPTFNDTAPAGAVFGYNLSQHSALEKVFPPIPVAAAAVIVDRGENLTGGTEVPLGSDGLVIIDANGIWWMSNCFGDAPWPQGLVNTPDSSSSSSASSQSSSSSSSLSSSSSAFQPECPREERMRIILNYVRMVFATDKSVVTSLAPADGSPVTVVNCDGDAAKTGDLKLGLNLDLTTEDGVLGSKVVKELTNSLSIKTGNVTEGLIAGNGNVSLSGTVQRNLDPDDPSSPLVHQGIVSVNVTLTPAEQELDPQIIRLDDAVERFLDQIPYVGFPPGRSSGIRIRVNVPPVGLPANPKLKFRALLFGTVTGTLPSMSFDRRTLVRPTASTPTPLPTSDTSLTFPSNTAVTAEEVIEVETSLFDIAAGDTVYATLSRSQGDGYTGEVGEVRLGAIIVAG